MCEVYVLFALLYLRERQARSEGAFFVFGQQLHPLLRHTETIAYNDPDSSFDQIRQRSQYQYEPRESQGIYHFLRALH